MIEDRRYRKTDKVLRESLAQILLVKPLHTITVKELTDRADVHRSTFYAHYADVYELYHHMEEEELKKIQNIIEKDYECNLTDCYKLLMNYVLENKELCRMIFMGENSYSVVHKIADMFYKSCRQYWSRLLGHDSMSPDMEFAINYHVQGCFALVRQWYRTDFEMPIGEMTELITSIDRAIADFVISELNDKA